jgi:hypothetical protein
VNPDFDFARKSTATPRNPAKSNTGFRPLLPAAQALSEFFTVDYLLGVIAREYAANFPHVDWRSILRWRHNTRL